MLLTTEPGDDVLRYIYSVDVFSTSLSTFNLLTAVSNTEPPIFKLPVVTEPSTVTPVPDKVTKSLLVTSPCSNPIVLPDAVTLPILSEPPVIFVDVVISDSILIVPNPLASEPAVTVPNSPKVDEPLTDAYKFSASDVFNLSPRSDTTVASNPFSWFISAAVAFTNSPPSFKPELVPLWEATSITSEPAVLPIVTTPVLLWVIALLFWENPTFVILLISDASLELICSPPTVTVVADTFSAEISPVVVKFSLSKLIAPDELVINPSDIVKSARLALSVVKLPEAAIFPVTVRLPDSNVPVVLILLSENPRVPVLDVICPLLTVTLDNKELPETLRLDETVLVPVVTTLPVFNTPTVALPVLSVPVVTKLLVPKLIWLPESVIEPFFNVNESISALFADTVWLTSNVPVIVAFPDSNVPIVVLPALRVPVVDILFAPNDKLSFSDVIEPFDTVILPNFEPLAAVIVDEKLPVPVAVILPLVTSPKVASPELNVPNVEILFNSKLNVLLVADVVIFPSSIFTSPNCDPEAPVIIPVLFTVPLSVISAALIVPVVTKLFAPNLILFPAWVVEMVSSVMVIVPIFDPEATSAIPVDLSVVAITCPDAE